MVRIGFKGWAERLRVMFCLHQSTVPEHFKRQRHPQPPAIPRPSSVLNQCRRPLIIATTTWLTACQPAVNQPPATAANTTQATAPAVTARQPTPSFYGTLEPFTKEAVYFVLTDRFVNGDPDNDYPNQGRDPDQGGDASLGTFDRPLPPCDGISANVGYLGGDFKGILDHADYIREMGFTALWITPIVENPDQAFSGGEPITCDSVLTDQGKAAYHGYWGINFYRVDEHLQSPNLSFAEFTQALQQQGLKTVLDIVGNHGSPAWSMPSTLPQTHQPQFGQVFDASGQLIADHQNLPPTQLDPQGNPLHRFYNTRPDLAQLGDFEPDNPQVMDYLTGAYLQWIDQGAAAFRIDTIRHMPHRFWKTFSQRIREQHPGFFMFGEAFDYEAENIAPHTWKENGGVSVLDFPLRRQLAAVFENPDSDFSLLTPALHLEDGMYRNPYELATFYDNHDMARLNASDEGFIDANNWLFTARGFPVVYYGSEMGFMRGRREHAGNRNYFGPGGIADARAHPIRAALIRIANLRRQSPALQQGLQLNLEFSGNQAAFYRVYSHQGIHQIALVLLNKGDTLADFRIEDYLQPGTWLSAFSNRALDVVPGGSLQTTVPAHGVEVFFYNEEITREDLIERLGVLMLGIR